MKKGTKKTISTLVATASVLGVAQPAVFAATTSTAVTTATTAVSKVEQNLSVYDYITAKVLVDNLPAGQDKTDLTARLVKVSVRIFTADYNAALASINAIATNHNSFTYLVAHKAEIASKIAAVSNGASKIYLNQAYVKAQAKVYTADFGAALKAIIAAETAKTQASVDTAQALVNKVTNGYNKVYLNDRLAKIYVALEVKSVNAISATQVLVTFNKEVDKADAETAARYQIGSLTVTPVLQADKKSVLLTTSAPITGTNLYIVNPVKSAVDATEKNAIFTYVETYTDTVAPTVAKVEYPTYDKATVTFSEPISDLGSVTFTQDGAPVTVNLTAAFVPGSTSVTYDLSDASVQAGKPVSAVIVGAKDMANNLIDPNPVSLSLTKTKTDTTAPTVSAINVLSDVRLSITFSEKLQAAPTVKVGGNAVIFAASDDGITWTGTFVPTTGVQKVDILAFSDVSSNAGTATSVVKQFTADTTKPVLNSSEVKIFNNKPYLVLHYSEDVDPVIGGQIVAGTRVKDYVSNTFTTVGAVTPVAYTKANGADVDDTKALILDLSSDVTFPVGTYTVTLPAAFAQDKASTPNTSDAASITFTKGTVTVNDTTAPTVNAVPVVSGDNKTVTVHFSEPVDYATALNVANYKVSGQSIFSSAIFSGDDQTVTLTVAPGTITYSGDRLVSVTGVKDKAGNVNTAYSNIVTFKENVAPYVASAKLTDANNIAVTFSENVAATTATDFEVYIGGVKVATGVATSVSGATKTATITLTAPITDLSKTIQVKLVNSATVDVNGNPAITGQFITVQ